MLPVEFHPIAVREIRDAVRWQVRNRSPDVAQRFKAELHVVLGIVRETPLRFPETIRGARRAILRRFR
jgi:plasmid stabilization system protein ParE